jgi:hypothetical protein
MSRSPRACALEGEGVITTSHDVGPMFRIGAVGAGIGIDALIRGRRTIDEAAHRSTRLQAAPIVGRRAGGLRVSIRF